VLTGGAVPSEPGVDPAVPVVVPMADGRGPTCVAT